MNDLDLELPAYYCAENIFNVVSNTCDKVVVYKDKYKHRGEGKELMSVSDALFNYPQNLVCEYIETEGLREQPLEYKSVSARLLHVGNARFWLFYGSKDDWRSNCGDVDIEVMFKNKSFGYTRVHKPLFAIDFVPKNDELYAIDFNTSPGLKNTGIEMSAKEVVSKIKKFYQEYEPNRPLESILTEREKNEVISEVEKCRKTC